LPVQRFNICERGKLNVTQKKAYGNDIFFRRHWNDYPIYDAGLGFPYGCGVGYPWVLVCILQMKEEFMKTIKISVYKLPRPIGRIIKKFLPKDFRCKTLPKKL